MGTAQLAFVEVVRGGATVCHVTGSDITGSHVTGRDPELELPGSMFCAFPAFSRVIFLL